MGREREEVIAEIPTEEDCSKYENNEKQMDNILYVDDEIANVEIFKEVFSEYFNIYIATDTKKARDILKKHEVKVVITDQRMPGEKGIEFIENIKEEYPFAVFMILSGYSDFHVTIDAINNGRVYRFLEKPWNESSLKIDIENAIERYNYLYNNTEILTILEQKNKELKELKDALEEENTYLKSEINEAKNFGNIITSNQRLLATLKSVTRIADSDASILIHGETGTGKELVARAVHNLSSRSKAPFIAVNCAAIPETLFESELFGYEKGAFTGALQTKKGKFELAQKGTLFLDEIGEVPLSMQPKILRALQEKTIERVGGTTSIKLDIRIVSATNRDLEEEIAKEKFRSDLYYRLNVFPVDIPPLRERIDDIPLLVSHFIDVYNEKYKTGIKSISKKGLSMLKMYEWPGNIRELENVIERAAITAESGKLNVEGTFGTRKKEEASKSYLLEDVEKRHIIDVLNKTSWKVAGKGSASEMLGLCRSTLQYRMKKLNIEKP